MLDIKWIRDNAEKFDQHLKNRGLSSQAERLITLDERRRKSIDHAQSIQSERKKKSGEVAGAKKNQNTVLAEQLIEEVSQLKEAHKQADDKAKQLSAELDHALSEQPNLPLDDVPIGSDENDNVEIRRRGQRPAFDFSPKEHFQIGEDLGLMDFKSAAQMSGARFVLLRGNLARLERALGQFMLDMHVNEHGYQEIAPPLLVRDEAMYGTGQLPKFKEDLFKAGDSHWLIPTAEVSLTNLAAQNIWSQDDLPMRFSALTACFRSEAGSAGRDVRGMLRQHQFMKCELVSITSQDASAAELERMLKSAEAVLKALKLPYRVITLCTGDMGPQARKTYDIEVWLPGQNRYREISSCSICGDYQARRMNARYRDENGKLNFVHTLNGSGVASGRALIAVLENCQNADGSVNVPEALQPYMGGLDVISKP